VFLQPTHRRRSAGDGSDVRDVRTALPVAEVDLNQPISSPLDLAADLPAVEPLDQRQRLSSRYLGRRFFTGRAGALAGATARSASAFGFDDAGGLLSPRLALSAVMRLMTFFAECAAAA
jgi:hypothetical protein